MPNETPDKRALWLERRGYFENATPENPRQKYEVVRAQNIMKPAVGDVLDQTAAEILITEGVTVNIS